MKKYTKDEILKLYCSGYKICHDSWVQGEYIYMTKKGIENYSTLGDMDLLRFMTLLLFRGFMTLLLYFSWHVTCFRGALAVVFLFDLLVVTYINYQIKIFSFNLIVYLVGFLESLCCLLNSKSSLAVLGSLLICYDISNIQSSLVVLEILLIC